MFGFLFGKKKLKLKEPGAQGQTVDDWKGSEITLRNEVEKTVTKPRPAQPGKHIELFEQLVYLNKHVNRIYDIEEYSNPFSVNRDDDVYIKLEAEIDTEYLGKIVDPICIELTGEVYGPDLRVCFNGNRFLPKESIGINSLIVLHYRQVDGFIATLLKEDAKRFSYIIMKLKEFLEGFGERFTGYNPSPLCCAYSGELEDLLDLYKNPEALAARMQAQLLLTTREK